MQITLVRLRVTTPQGQPVAGVTVSARLASLGVSATDGYIDRSHVEAVTDDAGIAELALWPSALGTSGAEYRITARGADGSKLLDELVTVPTSDVAVWLHDIVMVPAPSPKPYDEAAIEAIRQDRILAQAASSEAQAARDASGISEQSAQTAAFETGSHLDAARTIATNAAAAATTAVAKANEATVSAATASNKAAESTASSGSALASSSKASQWAENAENTAVETGKYSAKHHALKAAASATGASGSASTAATKAGEASTSATNAAASATTATTKASEASTSATNAAASASTATTKATEASTSATTAGVKATEASNSATSASTSSTKAGQWAENAENVAVETGKYSAKHHAIKAAASASSASSSASSASTSAGTSTTKASEAATSATNAASSASTATTKASEASTSATSAASANTAAQSAKTAAEAARDEATQAAAAVTGALVELGSVNLSGGVYPAKPGQGAFWKVTVGGTVGGVDYGVGDTLVYSRNLDQFYKIDNTESVSSVGGQTGVVTKAGLGIDQLDNTRDLDKPVSTAQQTALDGKVDKESGKSLLTDAERTKLGGIAAGAQVNVATNLGQGTRTSTGIPLTSSTGTGTTLPAATTTLAGLQSAADKIKLNGIASGATANETDAQLRDRSTHTGEQAISTVTGLSGALVAKQDALASGTNIKTVNGESLLGAGDIVIAGGTGSGGAGLTLFEESRNTASPNATVPVHALTALGDEADIDFVINPKGTGAILTRVPDGTSVGGNKRGAGALDLQSSRGVASQVASGANSVAIGSSNTASGANSVAIGSNSFASGSYSVAMGCINNASGSYSVAMGYNSSASGSYSVAMGSAVTTRGIQGCFATGYTVVTGRQQMVSYPLRYDTTTATATQLTASGSTPGATSIPVMPNNSTYSCRVRVLARNTTTNEAKTWVGTALIRRGVNAAATVLVGSSITAEFGDSAMDACTVSLSADTTLGGLAVIVTGLSSTTVRWVANVETVEAA